MSLFDPLTSILNKNKLEGRNYVDWKRNLDGVLTAKEYKFLPVYECPEKPVEDATNDQFKAYGKWIKVDEMMRRAASEEILEVIKPVCVIIYSLVTVCGHKAVVKFFPQQVSDLELAVSLLEKCHNAQAVTSLRQESTGEMEAKCVILLWLYVLVLILFDISSVDIIIVDNNYAGGDEPPPLVLRILEFSKDYLSSVGPMQTIAGLLLSRLLTRPDMTKAFTRSPTA
ncbi:hypothetical protein FXO38_09833 [Capsicum annuum]|nr:hypothetical protein FXO38_09833 [Capsicum annuum]